MSDFSGDGAWAKGWYSRNYPDNPDVLEVEDRCWSVLTAVGQIYNITNRSVVGGGLSFNGDGLWLLMNTGVDLATYDGSGLTRLIVAAHNQSCRVGVRAEALMHAVHYGYGDIGFQTMSSMDYEDGEDYDRSLTARCDTCDGCIERTRVSSPWVHETGGECSDTVPNLPTIETGGAALMISVHPRSPDTDRIFERHPTSADLISFLTKETAQ